MCKGITEPKDDRGLLFFEIARIAEAKQPRLLLLENVKGLISSAKGEAIRVIIETLNAIGYTVDFNVLNSKFFGVPQNRERIFIVGILNGEIEPWKIEGTNVVAKGKKRISAYEGVKTFNFDWPTQDTVTTRLRDILEDEVDERYYLSEDKTAKLIAQLEEQRPSITDEIKCYNPRDIDTVEQTRMQDRVYDIEGNTVALTSFCDRMNIAEPQMIGHVDIKGHDAIKRVYSVEGVSPTLTTMGGGHREPKILEDSRYIGTLADHERFKDVYGVLDVDGQCTTLTTMQGGGREPKVAVKSIGNVNPSGDGMNGQVYDSKGLSPTLTTNKGEGTKITVSEVRPVLSVAIREATKQGYTIAEVGDSINVQFPNSKTRRGRVGKGVAQTLETSCNQATLTPSYRIRKLTPKECFRLQGFADYKFDKLVGTSISNSQLYKMAGNAVTVNVIEAIGTRLLKYLSHNEIGSRYVTEKGA
ncbi:DNA (cytosine-5-)-methyltransferase [Bacillus toyonensis]|nr:DNA (cytosine-5-)-methyltransferase [Bacillus toyonensis]